MKANDTKPKAYIASDHSIVIDERIFTDIAAGDKRAFADLYNASSKAIYAYLMTYVKNPDDAADLMQDTYLKVRSAAGIYQAYGKPMAWLFTIARNLALMKLRQNAAHPQEALDTAISAAQTDMKQAEDRLVLTAAMSILSEEDYRIVMLHAVAGLKHREIAELLGIGLSNTLNRYNRALKKLRKEIGGDLYE
jgi:RNA polymerase sigma-70 factor (ECF subfamily)